MVGPANPVSRSDERGQLLLIGAISIAFILLGVVVVFNGVQYTETVNSGSAGDDLDDVDMVKSELSDNLKRLEANATDNEMEDYVENIYAPAKYSQKPVHITAEISGGTATITYTTDDTSVTFEVNIP